MLVQATIGKGTIRTLDTSAAEKMPGVLLVFHHGNMEGVYRPIPHEEDGTMSESRPLFDDDKIYYWGQYVAAVVAETLEQANAGAEAVRVEYDAEKPDVRTDLGEGFTGQRQSSWKRGDPDQALSTAPVIIDETYSTPVETHNPDGDARHRCGVGWRQPDALRELAGRGESSHGDVGGARSSRENVRVISRFIGSGFGGKLFPWPQSTLAAAAARQLKRPVKAQRRSAHDVLERRPSTAHRAAHSPRRNARTASSPRSATTFFRRHRSSTTSWSAAASRRRSSIAVRISVVTAAMVRRNVGAPAPMRGPGAVPGLFGLESAMDELAIKLNMDPLELRLKNDAERDEGKNLPFSSRHLKECYTTGAEKIGWKQRTPQVGSMRRNGKIIGMGPGGCIVVRGAHPLHRQRGAMPQRPRLRSLRDAGYRHRNLHRLRTGDPRENGRAARSHRRFPRRQLLCPTGRHPAVRWPPAPLLPAATSAVNEAVTRLLHIADD